MKKEFLIGVDIGGTSVKIGLFTYAGTLLEKRSFKTCPGSDRVIMDTAAQVMALMGSHSVSPERVIGMGIGVPGPVDKAGVVHGCVNMGWGDVPIVSSLSMLCRVPAAAQNDANIAALGELWQGAGRGHENVVMLTLGTGVGGAVVFDGRLMQGANGGGGELGHICVNPHETAVCSCKRRGCLEQYASATGIVRMARELLTSEPDIRSRLHGCELTAKAVFEAWEAGDEAARRVIAVMTEMLGFGIATIVTICDPERVIIGGGVSLAGEPLLEAVRAHFGRMVYKDMTGAEIVLSKLGSDAGIYGGAYMALQRFDYKGC